MTLSPNHSLGDDRYLLIWVTPMTSFLKEFKIRDKKKWFTYFQGWGGSPVVVSHGHFFAHGKGVKRSKKHSYHGGKKKRFTESVDVEREDSLGSYCVPGPVLF